jgi:hypothetical protein
LGGMVEALVVSQANYSNLTDRLTST